MLYGIMDVPLCETSLIEQAPMYRALAARLPRPAHWKVSPLSRTSRTARAIFAAGYPPARLDVEPDVIEQSLGEWQGLAHADLPERLELGAHAFWPLRAGERPPGGESLIEVVARIGGALDRMAVQHAGEDVVIVSHGGAIRAALAHAIGSAPDVVLHFSIQNLSLTRLERHHEGWRVVCVNELPGY
jgi:alpha-ribazole phosphatase